MGRVLGLHLTFVLVELEFADHLPPPEVLGVVIVHSFLVKRRLAPHDLVGQALVLHGDLVGLLLEVYEVMGLEASVALAVGSLHCLVLSARHLDYFSHDEIVLLLHCLLFF